jgi:hypothetical protein
MYDCSEICLERSYLRDVSAMKIIAYGVKLGLRRRHRGPE